MDDTKANQMRSKGNIDCKDDLKCIYNSLNHDHYQFVNISIDSFYKAWHLQCYWIISFSARNQTF